MSADRFALVEIANVHFDGRQVTACEAIAKSKAGMGKRTGVDDQSEDFAVREDVVDLVDNEAFVIRLVKLDLHTQRLGFLGKEVFQIGQGLVAVDGGLPHAESVQIRAVDDDNAFHGQEDGKGREMNRAFNQTGWLKRTS